VTPITLIILGLATWRLASLFANEAGPFYIFKHLRRRCKELCRCHKWARRFHLYELIECEWCNSVWFGTGIALLYWWNPDIATLVCLPLALSTITIIIKLTIIHPPERK
jgi:uncharacterized protein DUF1360